MADDGQRRETTKRRGQRGEMETQKSETEKRNTKCEGKERKTMKVSEND